MLSNQSINDVIESVNQDSEIWFINCKINCSSVRSHSEIVRSSLIVFLLICSTYLFDNCTSHHLSTYLLDILQQLFEHHLHYSSRYLTKTHAFARQIDAFSSFSFRELLNLFDIELFNSLVMKSSIFAFSSNIQYFDCNITLRISHSITISISSSLRSLFTYEEQLASLKFCLRFSETTRHFKTVMIVADFSEDDCDSDFNYMQCFICSLILFSEYFTFESLKKHLHETSHCSLVIQLQQEKIAEEKIVVEKQKIESFSALPVKSLSTYEERLTILTNWFWVASLNRERVIVAELRSINDKFRARCTHCLLMLFDTNKNSFKEHLDKSSECSLVLQLKTTRLETSEEIKRAELTALKVAKLILVAADIDFFDATLLCDIQEFDLHHETTSFCQHLQNIQINYREIDLVQLLHICLRDSAFVWYQEQSKIVKKNLSEWLEVLIIAFFAKSSANSSIQTSSSVSSASFSSQYHSCLNCFAFFSSLTRLLQHIQIVCQKVVCKQCEKIFESKNKLHDHIRQHHAKKIVKDASRRNFNRERDKISTTISSTISTIISSKTTSKFSISRSVTSSEQTRNSPTSSRISVATSRQIISSKSSRLSTSTLKIISKRVEIASSTSLATSTSMSRKSQKLHLTVDDLIRMFAEKSRLFDLSQHQNRRSSSQSSDARQLCQSRIIVYFLSAVNQKTSISQSLKSSNSKSFQQHTSAKSLSLYRSVLSEKSILSSYKMTDIFYISLRTRFSFAWSRSIFSSTSSSLLESSSSDFYVCCICFDRSNFRNDLFNYSRLSQRYLSN